MLRLYILNLTADDLFLRGDFKGKVHHFLLGGSTVLDGVSNYVEIDDQKGDPADWFAGEWAVLGGGYNGGAPRFVRGLSSVEERPVLFTGVYASGGESLASRMRFYAPSEALGVSYFPVMLAAAYEAYTGASPGAAGLEVNAVLAMHPSWSYSPDGVHLFSCSSGEPVPYGSGIWVDMDDVVEFNRNLIGGWQSGNPLF